MMSNQLPGHVDSDYLDLISARLLEVKQLSYSSMRVAPGHKVLDVGCGPGNDTISLGRAVGATGQVIGIDIDQAMIDEAIRRAQVAGCAETVKHKLADACALPFENGLFDSSRAERLFQHLASPEKVLSEMSRVTRNGGWIVALDTDWGALSLDFVDISTERKIARFLAEHVIQNGFSGRSLYRLFKKEGLSEVSAQSVSISMIDYSVARLALQLDRVEQQALAAKAITMDELEAWRNGLKSAAENDVFFGTIGLVLVAGKKV